MKISALAAGSALLIVVPIFAPSAQAAAAAAMQRQTTVPSFARLPPLTNPVLRSLAQMFPFGLGGMYGGGGGYGGGGLYGDVATTPIQGIGYGIAHIIRAEGDFLVNASQAAINLTEARRRAIDNFKLWTVTYFEVRRLNREARTAERGKMLTEADFIRYAQIGKPRRLTPSELDSITGQIVWPVALQAAEFTSVRDEVSKLYAKRAANGTLGLDECLKADQVTQVMLDKLRQRIYDLPAFDYLIARRFLESLAYEARFPAI